jgi:chromosome segregation ATPase
MRSIDEIQADQLATQKDLNRLRRDMRETRETMQSLRDRLDSYRRGYQIPAAEKEQIATAFNACKRHLDATSDRIGDLEVRRIELSKEFTEALDARAQVRDANRKGGWYFPKAFTVAAKEALPPETFAQIEAAANASRETWQRSK